MLAGRKLMPVKRKHLGGLSIPTIISIIWVAFSMEGTDNDDIVRREVLLRRIGHQYPHVYVRGTPGRFTIGINLVRNRYLIEK